MKTIGDNTKRFKVRINQHISECKTGVSTYEFPHHVYDCGIKNNCLQEPFFSLNMLRLNKNDTMNNRGRNYNQYNHSSFNQIF